MPITVNHIQHCGINHLVQCSDVFIVAWTADWVLMAWRRKVVCNECVETLSVSNNHNTQRHTVWVKKIPPEDLWQFFQNGWEFFNQISHAYYAFLSTLPATLTKLCHIKREHPVHIMCAKCPPSAKTHFLTFFPNSSEFLV